MSKFKCHCNNCGQSFDAIEEDIGREFTCTKCNNSFVATKPAETTDKIDSSCFVADDSYFFSICPECGQSHELKEPVAENKCGCGKVYNIAQAEIITFEDKIDISNSEKRKTMESFLRDNMSKNPFSPIKHWSSDVEFVDMVMYCKYYLYMDVVALTRSTYLDNRIYHNDVLPENPLKMEDVDVWHAISMDEDGIWKKELPDSRYVGFCDVCRGRGDLSCDKCSGTGRIKCFQCSGKGVVKDRSLLQVRDDGNEAICPNCNGNGFKPCSNCQGQGRTPCFKCKGMKELLYFVVLEQKEVQASLSDEYLHDKDNSPLIEKLERNEIYERNLANWTFDSGELPSLKHFSGDIWGDITLKLIQLYAELSINYMIKRQNIRIGLRRFLNYRYKLKNTRTADSSQIKETWFAATVDNEMVCEEKGDGLYTSLENKLLKGTDSSDGSENWQKTARILQYTSGFGLSGEKTQNKYNLVCKKISTVYECSVVISSVIVALSLFLLHKNSISAIKDSSINNFILWMPLLSGYSYLFALDFAILNDRPIYHFIFPGKRLGISICGLMLGIIPGYIYFFVFILAHLKISFFIYLVLIAAVCHILIITRKSIFKIVDSYVNELDRKNDNFETGGTQLLEMLENIPVKSPLLYAGLILAFGLFFQCILSLMVKGLAPLLYGGTTIIILSLTTLLLWLMEASGKSCQYRYTDNKNDSFSYKSYK